jgi:hypothetical protein
MSEDQEPTLKTPQEWAADLGYRIYDPNGWRMWDAPPFDQPTTWQDFEWRFAMSTTGPLPKENQWTSRT